MWHCRFPANSCKILYSSGISLGNLQYILISPCLPFHIWQPQKWNHLLIIRMQWSTDLCPSTRPSAKDNLKNEKNSILLSLFPLSPFSAWERHHLEKDDHSILKARREKKSLFAICWTCWHFQHWRPTQKFSLAGSPAYVAFLWGSRHLYRCLFWETERTRPYIYIFWLKDLSGGNILTPDIFIITSTYPIYVSVQRH